MLSSSPVRLLAAAAALSCLVAVPAHAGSARLVAAMDNAPALAATFIDVSLAGFQSVGDFGDPGNTTRLLDIGIGSTVTGWDFRGLSFTTQGNSWLSEFVVSVNNSDATEWFDATLSDVDAGGTFGPASGSFGVDTPLFDGADFVVGDGKVLVTVYELFDDAGVDAIVSAGTLRIYFNSVTAVPEPGTYGLMALGALGVIGAARRRRNQA